MSIVTVYILEFNESKEKFYFMSMKAIYDRFSSEKIKVAYKTLTNYNLNEKPYTNSVITLTKVKAYRTGDYQKEQKRLKEKLKELTKKIEELQS